MPRRAPRGEARKQLPGLDSGMLVPHGVPELTRFLKELKQDVRMRRLRDAMKRAGQVIAEAIEEEAPSRTGKLKKSVVVKTKSSRARGRVSVFVGPTAFYWYMVEYGHPLNFDWMLKKKRRAPSKPGKRGAALEQGSSGKRYVPPHPFVAPAFDRSEGRARREAREYLRAALKRWKKKTGYRI